MTKAKLVFDPFSQDFFQGRLRDVPPDARRGAGLLQRGARLLRADPARRRRARVQGLRDVLVEVRCRPFVGQERRADDHGHEDDHLHGPARAPQHAQPAEQGVHSARHPGAEGDGDRQGREVPQPPRSGRVRRGAGVHGAVSRRGHHDDAGCPRGSGAAGPTLDRRRVASRGRPGRGRREGNAGEHRKRDVLPRTGCRSGEHSPKTTSSPS